MYSWEIWSAGFSIIQDEGKYLIIGQTGHPLNYYWNQIGIMAINNEGEKLWSYTIGDTISRYYSGLSNSFIKSDNEDIFFCGTKKHYEGPQVHNKGIIAKLSDSYDVLWMEEYGDIQLPGDTSDLFNSMVIDEESNIFVCGDRIIYTPATDYSKFLCVKLDSSGSVIWNNTYGLDRTNRAYSIVRTTDGGVAIGGINIASSDIQSADPIVVKTNVNGDQEWIHNLGSDYYDNRALLSQDGDGIIIATTIADSATPGSDFSYSRITVQKIDLDGNEIWIKKYGESRKKNHIRSIKRIDNQGFIICGYVRTEPGPWYSSWALRIDNFGDSIFYREYAILRGSESENYLFDILPTSDQGFIACGYIVPYPPDTGNMQSWVIKLDSNGCDTPGCQTVEVFEPEEILTETLLVYPNPSSEKVTLKTTVAACGSMIYIYNLYGIKQDEIIMHKNKKQIQIDVSKYPSGVYLAILKDERKIIAKRKFIVN